MKRTCAKPPAASNQHRQIANALSRWFARHQRDLPWRRRRNGYTALVAEVMLQQTQAARVAERFPRFLRQFPTVKALARANGQHVLKAWEGLGYYRRALMLHAAAKLIATERNGRVPQTSIELRQLPGVGQYTAGAIASIVYGERAAIVDGNVRRVLGRLRPRPPRSEQATWAEAERLVNAAADPSAFNEALMELGATVCTPRRPRCADCPLKKWCRSCDREGKLPHHPPAERGRKRIVHHHALLLRRSDGRILLEQRNGDVMWRGMWQTPTVESDRPLSLIEIKTRAAISASGLQHCGTFKHETTHRRVVFHVYRASTKQRKGTWCNRRELNELPISNAHQRVLRFAMR